MPELDPTIVSLAKAIRYTESGDKFDAKGKSGEIGAYQYMPTVWKDWAKKYKGDENAPLTPENQNEVAYKRIEDLKKQGYNPGQIASIWNSGSPDPTGKVGVNKYGAKYDVPAYVQKVYSKYQEFKGVPVANAATTTAPQPAQAQQPSFGGFLGNVFKSTGRLIGNTASALGNIVNPNPEKNTVVNLANLGVGAIQNASAGLMGQNVPRTREQDLASAVGNFYGQRYGGLGNIANTLYEDPAGVAADASAVLGGVGLATRGTQFGSVASRAATVLDPINAVTKPAAALGAVINKTAAFGAGIPSRLGYRAASDVLDTARQGGSALDQMTDAARGGIPEQTFVDDLQQARNRLAKQKSLDYERALNDIDSNYRQTALKQGSNNNALVFQNNKLPARAAADNQAAGETFSLSTQGPKSVLSRALKDFNITTTKSGKLDFRNSPIPRTDYKRIQDIADDLRSWSDFTPRGLNNLENKISGYYVRLEGSKSAGNRVTAQVAADLRQYLRERVTEFRTADLAYQKTSALLGEFKRDLSLGGKAGPETILRKIKKAATTDGDLRAGLISELNKLTDKDIRAITLGLKSQSWTPQGLLAGAVGVGSFIHPQLLAALAFSSPRFAFEFLRALGVTERKAAALAKIIRESRAAIVAAQAGRINSLGTSEPTSESSPRPGLGSSEPRTSQPPLGRQSQ